MPVRLVAHQLRGAFRIGVIGKEDHAHVGLEA
jgi:hypothetical protein